MILSAESERLSIHVLSRKIGAGNLPLCSQKVFSEKGTRIICTSMQIEGWVYKEERYFGDVIVLVGWGRGDEVKDSK